jgi:UDP-N-acetylglucosamine:LPS N-acetylglucosamine transferase
MAPADYSIAYFVSPHGYGHAARAGAVMAAMHELNPSIRFEIFTTIPQWFFQQSIPETFTYHSLLTDIGVVQETPLSEDLPETLRKLDNFLPYDQSQITSLSKEIHRLKCRLIICDISPMGIAVAQKAGIPSVLVENFTWDWVYENYVSTDFPAGKFVDYLREIYHYVDYHIQTEPVCCYQNADLCTAPISRKIRAASQQIRQELAIPDGGKVVMITMGGIPERYLFLEQLTHQSGIYFIIPGGSQTTQLVDNLVLLPHHSDFFHPDLVNACDAVIGKLGYSTLAEVYHAGIPFGYIPRSTFKESEVLEAFVKNQMNGCAISESQYQDGSWVSLLPEILALPGTKRNGPNGAVEAAQFVCNV